MGVLLIPLSTVLDNILNSQIIILFFAPLFFILNIFAGFTEIFVPESYVLSTFILGLNIILTLITIILMGIFIQKIIKEKSNKLIVFLGIGLFILIMVSFIWINMPTPDVLPGRCAFGAEFQCNDYQISVTKGTFRIRLKNNIGESIIVDSINLKTGSYTPIICTPPSNLPTASNPWQNGKILQFDWTSCTSMGDLVAGQKGKILVNIKYYLVSDGPTIIKEANGEVFSTVE